MGCRRYFRASRSRRTRSVGPPEGGRSVVDWCRPPGDRGGPGRPRGRAVAPMADHGRPLADVVIDWLASTPAGGGGLSALAVVVEYSGLGEAVDAYRPVHRGSLPALERGAGPGEIRDLPFLPADDAPVPAGARPGGVVGVPIVAPGGFRCRGRCFPVARARGLVGAPSVDRGAAPRSNREAQRPAGVVDVSSSRGRSVASS